MVSTAEGGTITIGLHPTQLWNPFDNRCGTAFPGNWPPHQKSLGSNVANPLSDPILDRGAAPAERRYLRISVAFGPPGIQRRAGRSASRRFSNMCPLVPHDSYPSSIQQNDNYHHSVIIRSAHSTSETKTAGLPNFAPQPSRSASVTPRAREQAPQEKTGMCFVTTLSRSSLRGGQPIGNIASAVALRMRYVASPVRKIRTSCPASDNASP